MKKNIFDGTKNRAYFDKDNIFAIFLQNSGLYDKIEINRENVFHLIDLIGGRVKIDEFCACCGEKRVFNIKPIKFYEYNDKEASFLENNLADEMEMLQNLNIIETRSNDGTVLTSTWDWKGWRIEDAVRLITFRFSCSMDESHKLDYVVVTDGNEMKKIGQYPSVADLSFPELKQYRKILSSDDEREIKRAVGLHAQGIGIGAFVYLRRVFERIIDMAKDNAIKNNAINIDEYTKAHVDERIKMLKDYLPKTLVESTAFYGVVSKGIHELSEDECLAFFPVLKDFIFMIVRQWEQLRKDEETEKSIKDSLNRIASMIK